MQRSDSHPSLEGFTVVVSIPVAWGEMDAFGHVNNAVYLRYFENARIAYLERIGFSDASEVGPILASAHCRFRRPIRFPDQLLVGTRTTDLADDRFTMEYRLVSTRLGAVATEGGSVVVSFDYASGQKAPLPLEVRKAIADLDGLV